MSASKPGEDVKHFVLAALIVIIAGLGAVAWFNWWENPFGAFDQPMRPHVNDTLSRDFLVAGRDQQIRWLIHQSRYADGGTLLIGASQLMYGVDVCAYPGMRRLALFALTDYEIDQAMRTIAPELKHSTTFLIALGVPGVPASPTPENRFKRLHRDLLGWPTTLVSFSELMASQARTTPGCAAETFPPSAAMPYSPIGLNERIAKAGAKVDNQSALQDMLDALAPGCARLGHHLFLFTSPIYDEPALAPTVDALIERRGRAIRAVVTSFNRQNPSCQVAFGDFAATYAANVDAHGPIKSDWFDMTHFRPVLGEQLLKAVLEMRPPAR